MSVGKTNVDHDEGNDNEETDEEDGEEVLGDDTAEGAVIFVLVVVKTFLVTDQFHFLF